MIDELATAAKQVGLDLIGMSDMLAENMQTWAELLAQNPESMTAKISAGFINKPSVTSGPEIVIDVQAPPDKETVLRTWAIEIRTGDDGKEYFNGIALTFAVDSQHARELIAKGGAIAREDIRHLLRAPTTQLATITISHESGGDGTKQTHGERYDFTVAELGQHPDDTTKVNQAMGVVLQTLKQSLK